MFQVSNSVPRSRPWPLALLWMGVAAISLVVTSLIYPLTYVVFKNAASDTRLVGSVIGLIGGLIIIVLQWLVLRRYFPDMQRWVPILGGILVLATLLERVVNGLATALIFALGMITRSTKIIENLDLAASTTAGLFWALLTGLGGWSMFRWLTRRAWLWPAALLLAELGQSIVTFTVLLPLLGSGNARSDLAAYGLINIAVSLAAAAMQAAVLVSFLRERTRPAVAAAV
jgi:hypothetical protein